jgi:predicted enzyme related to lactoylglutathione lyase
MSAAFLGLRTAKYRAPDIIRARDWYSQALGIAPYFDKPFYVGFNVGGFELGLDPDLGDGRAGEGGVTVYWGVEQIEPALERLLMLGARPRSNVQDVGDGIRMATVFDPFDNVLGLIENPHFKGGG